MDLMCIALNILTKFSTKFEYDHKRINLNELTAEEIQELIETKKAQLDKYKDINSAASRKCKSNIQRINIIEKLEIDVYILSVELDKHNREEVLHKIDKEACEFENIKD
jgi:hypothetical protein